ncbi:MAG: hypothetical protein JW744_05625 [Candidatus Diapherotrites archaeon]|uniref:THUMP domain-containing protein n=1 Tax=Candidatus Iainarchaeum sp. TaxID=3101447 RepID=A0A939C577_9ARCH|nr:hypothetical protein [Candidatus Diapherotrites archaeon]
MQEKHCLLIKTASEIALKSNYVRQFFTKKLIQSIKFALKKNNIKAEKIIRGGGRLYLFCSNPKKAQKILLNVSGIHAIALAECNKGKEYSEIENSLAKFAKPLLKKGQTFALDVNVSNNKAFSARDLERRLGAAIQKEIPGLTVKLKGPEKEISIEVRTKDFFFYLGQKQGLGGLPLGVEGNVAFFFSGKKDELLAAFLLMHRGCNIFPIVKKKTPALQKHIHKLVKFNNCRKFILTGEKNLKSLLSERRIQAIATSDCKTDSKSLSSYKSFDSKQELLVLRPLLLCPKEK